MAEASPGPCFELFCGVASDVLGRSILGRYQTAKVKLSGGRGDVNTGRRLFPVKTPAPRYEHGRSRLPSTPNQPVHACYFAVHHLPLACSHSCALRQSATVTIG